MNTKTYKLGEIFCGPGGIARGALDAGVIKDNTTYKISHAWATDYDEDTCETYRFNICPESPKSVLCRDIRKAGVLDALGKISAIDGLAFGFPCNDFSIVGEQKGIDGVYGPLYSYGIQALEKFQPEWFIAENVGGLRNANEGSAFQTILHEMIHAGYHVTPHLYKFEKYGVPQARHRIIIVGFREDLDIKFKVPSCAPYKNEDVSCRNAIINPPIPNDAPNNELTKQSEAVIKRLEHIKPGENAFNATLPEHLKLNVKGATMSQIYRRLDPNKPAYTVTGSGGGGTHVYHWEEARALTNRERARLQTFPDKYEFKGSKESARKQIGMAVPPRGMKIIFNALLSCLAGVEYLSEPANIPVAQSMFDKQAATA